MVFSEFAFLYIPFLILSIAATVIASQAMISGIFSIVYQGITTRIMPLLRIEYTSPQLRSQIYIDVVNWMLLCAVLLVIVIFRFFQQPHPCLWSCGMRHHDHHRHHDPLDPAAPRRDHQEHDLLCRAGQSRVIFLISNLHKIPYGGYVSLLIAFIPLCVILIYVKGQSKLANALSPVPLEEFLPKFDAIYPR